MIARVACHIVAQKLARAVHSPTTVRLAAEALDARPLVVAGAVDAERRLVVEVHLVDGFRTEFFLLRPNLIERGGEVVVAGVYNFAGPFHAVGPVFLIHVDFCKHRPGGILADPAEVAVGNKGLAGPQVRYCPFELADDVCIDFVLVCSCRCLFVLSEFPVNVWDIAECLDKPEICLCPDCKSLRLIVVGLFLGDVLVELSGRLGVADSPVAVFDNVVPGNIILVHHTCAGIPGVRVDDFGPGHIRSGTSLVGVVSAYAVQGRCRSVEVITVLVCVCVGEFSLYEDGIWYIVRNVISFVPLSVRISVQEFSAAGAQGKHCRCRQDGV